MKNYVDLGGCCPPRPSASVDNILLDLHNSSHPTQPHSVISKYMAIYTIMALLFPASHTYVFFQIKYSVFIETKGKPGEVICKLVKEKDALMVVMGSRGLGTIRRTILGSVSQYCIDHAHVPVTVIPPPS